MYAGLQLTYTPMVRFAVYAPNLVVACVRNFVLSKAGLLTQPCAERSSQRTFAKLCNYADKCTYFSYEKLLLYPPLAVAPVDCLRARHRRALRNRPNFPYRDDLCHGFAGQRGRIGHRHVHNPPEWPNKLRADSFLPSGRHRLQWP